MFSFGPASGDKGLPGHLGTWVQRSSFDLKRRLWFPEPSLRVLKAERVRGGGTEDLEGVVRKRSTNVGMRRSVGFLQPYLVPRNYPYSLEGLGFQGVRS